MPDGMTGRTWRKSAAEKASLKVIYTSGYSSTLGRISCCGGLNYLQKPFVTGKAGARRAEMSGREVIGTKDGVILMV